MMFNSRDWRFENLVISDKCKTIKNKTTARWIFENLVISDKCKTKGLFVSMPQYV